MKDAVTSVKFDDEKKAEKRFEKAMDEWNSHSAFYRLAHRGEKPKVEDFYREEFISEYGVGGKSR